MDCFGNDSITLDFELGILISNTVTSSNFESFHLNRQHARRQGWERKSLQILFIKFKEKVLRRYDDNIKMHLKEIGFKV